MRCRHCQKLGHTKKWCKNPPSCDTCNLPPHETPCSRTFCANCSAEHPASSRTCTKFIQAKKIIEIKTKNQCSMREAIKIQKEQFPSFISPSTTYSTIAKMAETTLNKTNDNTTNKSLSVSPGDSKNKTTETLKTLNSNSSSTSNSIKTVNMPSKPISSSSLLQTKTAIKAPEKTHP